jgi:ATP phosphoribosyltransferase
MSQSRPLRVAVPNKGTLSESAVTMLTEAGYVGRRDIRALTVPDPRNNVEFYYLRPRDIATYVGSGALDVGITGRDLLIDSGAEASELKSLDFGHSTFRFAAPDTITELTHLAGKRVATSYPVLVERFLAGHGVTADIIRLDGAVESAVRLGVADAVADVVSTGMTLAAQGLSIFGPVILDSEAVLIARDQATPGVDTLEARLQGVLVARQFVLMDYDLPQALLEKASKITPGLESPTVSPLRDPEWVAVRAMVKRGSVHQAMDQLYALGARAILVSTIHAARI